MKLEVMSQRDAELYEPTEREVCISISAPHGELWYVPLAVLSDKFEDVLRLEFADTIDDPYITYRSNEGITNEQCDEIVNFVSKHKDVDKIVLHCFAGVSRSRSTAAAIVSALKMTDQLQVHNTLVFDRITKAFENRNESQKKTPKE